MKKIITLILTILLSFTVVAVDFNELTDSLEKSKLELVGQELPDSLAIMLGDERINVHVELQNEGEIVVAIVTENDKLIQLDFNTLDDPGLNVYIDDETLEKIQTSDNQLGELQQALDNGKLTYKAVGFFNKIKFAMVSMFVKMTGGFAEDYKKSDLAENVVVVEDNSKDEEEVSEGTTEETIEKELEVKEESLEEEVNNELIEKVESTNEKEVEEIKTENVKKDQIVEITDDGFSPDVLNIKSGETIIWKNVRDGQFKKSMIVGAQKCIKVRSEFYQPGEEFSWTFTEPLKCTIVDGMVTTQTMKIIVE